MLKVEEKVTTFWHNNHPDKLDPYVINSGLLRLGQEKQDVDKITLQVSTEKGYINEIYFFSPLSVGAISMMHFVPSL